MSKVQFKNIELFRFVFAILIVFFHGREVITLPNWLEGIKHCSICVDFFFIIAGFFLFHNFKQNTDTYSFAIKRFFRLAPNLWLSMLIAMIASVFIKGIHFNYDGNILRLFLLHNVGFSPLTGGTTMVITWFISVLFWVSLFYFYICKIFDKKYLNLIIWMIVVFCYAIWMQYSGFNVVGHWKNANLVFNIGIIRGLASMGFGYFISMAYDNHILQNISKRGKLIISLLESFIIGFLSYYLIYSSKLPGKSAMVEIVLFAVLFYLFLIKQRIISKFFDKDIFVKLGRYSYSIYCFHGIILALFREYIFKIYPQVLINFPMLSYLFHIVCAVCFGIMLFYIFEQPINRYIKQKMHNL